MAKEASGESKAGAKPAGVAKAAGKKKKAKKISSTGVVYIHATFNNTIVTITDNRGDVVSWSSSGANGFKGSRKSTPFASQVAGEAAARKARDLGMKNVHILVKGPGAGRESALRAIFQAGLSISSIKDVTPVPHNGCRAKKARRV